MKKVIVTLFALSVLASCGVKQKENVEDKTHTGSSALGEQIQVISTIVPLASLVETIGGEYIETSSLVPAGRSPHGFDLSPKQLVEIKNSDLVVSLGLEHIDGFLDKAIGDKNNLVVSEGIELLESSGDHHHDHWEEEHNDEHENEIHDDHLEDQHDDELEADHHEEETHSTDPHIWTSPENALLIADKIQKELALLDPDNIAVYEANYKKFLSDVSQLQAQFEQSIQGKTQKEFIVFHNAYNYLFDYLGVDQSKKLVFQENVMSEPNSAEFKELIDEITLHGVQDVFIEPQFVDSSLEKIAKKYTLNVSVLDPLGSDINSGGYLKNIASNIEKLQNIYE